MHQFSIFSRSMDVSATIAAELAAGLGNWKKVQHAGLQEGQKERVGLLSAGFRTVAADRSLLGIRPMSLSVPAHA
jgi:hypothetical protein